MKILWDDNKKAPILIHWLIFFIVFFIAAPYYHLWNTKMQTKSKIKASQMLKQCQKCICIKNKELSK